MSKKDFVGLSCITVGTGQGGTISMLARVSVVDTGGNVLYDAYVKPTSKVESYRFATTGLDASYFVSGEYPVPFEEAQLTVARWLAGKIVIGHQLWLDLQVLGLPHPAVDTRDVSLYLPFRATLKRPNEILGLPTLVWHLMRRKIQAGFLDSAESARAAMDLYQSYERQWEESVLQDLWPCALPPVAFARHYT
ncbi:hypothetical protein M407DRAFT_65934 [Tulasnella calospora MUT 4182]|uniref:Exonuclease domain-containing protein n=1 Tax=Tulasnella calospora MUT 4182 TaxID=1051891 RepID=A0A0C3LG27_9AGAM|nr:hypothetical protein M407DRAFT_65934 [Tulasnella calospora MUT 4182]